VTSYDTPNQQVVRADGSGAGVDQGPAAGAAPAEQAGPNPDEMTKAELLAYAKQLGVEPANNDMTKDELRAGVDAKLAGG
jgi:hypothetical protein